MKSSQENYNSQPATIFRDLVLPERAFLAGYAALIETLELKVSLPRKLCAISSRHRSSQTDTWHLYSSRYMPSPDLAGNLTFALKYEGLDLAVLKAIFLAVGPKPVEAFVRSAPTSRYSRRVWFLYEWLLDEMLDLPNAESGSYVPVVDSKMQVAVKGKPSGRHRVRNNMPGTPAFCPMVSITDKLASYLDLDMPRLAAHVADEVPADVLARAAAFLLLKDSKSSFEIEGEHPAHDRIQRWGRAIAEAGRQSLTLQELCRLQQVLISDGRFVKLGLRTEGGFVGEHDRDTGMPLPDHISAKPEDLEQLIAGLVAYDLEAALEINPVIAAAVIAFGFVYIHPFEDGNGRLHRYLIHHVFARRGFNPPGVIFPISAAMLDQIQIYRQVLETYSSRLLPMIQWEPTIAGNVKVTGETADFYRFFDATPHAEFLFKCVEQTIVHDLPAETTYLKQYDAFMESLKEVVDMPPRTSDMLFRFLRQNNGTLSQRARAKEFSKLTEAEIVKLEHAYMEAFNKNPDK